MFWFGLDWLGDTSHCSHSSWHFSASSLSGANTRKQTLGKMGICLWQHCQSPESWSCSPCSWATPHSSNLLSHIQWHQLHLSRDRESYLCLWDSQIQVYLHCHEPWASSKLVYEQILPSTPSPLFLQQQPQSHRPAQIIVSSVLTPKILQVTVHSHICLSSLMCSFIHSLSYQSC